MVTREGSSSSTIGSGASDCSEAVCPVCSKSFASKKAEYGHMRCHPERGWRGAHPPPPSAASQKIDGLSPSTMEPVGASGPASGTIIASSSTSISSNTDGSSWNVDEVNEQNQGMEEPCRMYKCSSCDKVFQTFQALGGHRSGHSYRKNLDDAGEESKGALAKRSFRCDVCSKMFPSGQALGGHKRAHFGETAKPCKSFDLNKPPPLENEEEP